MTGSGGFQPNKLTAASTKSSNSTVECQVSAHFHRQISSTDSPSRCVCFIVCVLLSRSAIMDLLPFGSSASCSLTPRPWRLSSQRSDPCRRCSTAHLYLVRGHVQSLKGLQHPDTATQHNTHTHKRTKSPLFQLDFFFTCRDLCKPLYLSRLRAPG